MRWPSCGKDRDNGMNPPGGSTEVSTDEVRRLHRVLARPGFLGDVLENLECIVLVLDLECRIVRFNRYFETLSGYALDEVRGGSWLELFVSPDEESRVSALWERTLAGGETPGAENEVRMRDGTKRRVHWSNRAVEDDDGVVGVLAIGHDVTDLSRANEQMQETAARMQAIVKTAGEGIITIEEDGTIRTFNRAAEKMFGWTADEVVGKNVRALMPEPYRSEHDQYLRHHVETGEKRIIGIGRGVAGQRKDGTIFPMHLAVSEVDPLDSRVFTGIVRDLSAEKELERHLDRVSAEERQRLAQNLHDELGGTMTAISILGSLLQRRLQESGSPEAERAALLVEQIREAQEQVRGVARGLLPVSTDPAGLMAALRGIARRTNEVAGLECSLECDAELEVHDRTVANHLYRLVNEAVENVVRHAHATRAQIRVVVEDGKALFLVEDDGRGLPEQAGPGRAGMGLRTMKYRAGLLGASFAVRSPPAGGTVVCCAVALERLGTGAGA